MPNTPDAPKGKGPNWGAIIVVAIMAILIAGQAGQVNTLLMVAGVVALALNGLWFIKSLSPFQRKVLLTPYLFALVSGFGIGTPALKQYGLGLDQVQGLFFVFAAICAFAGGGVLAIYFQFKNMMGQTITEPEYTEGLPLEHYQNAKYQQLNPIEKMVVSFSRITMIWATLIFGAVIIVIFNRFTPDNINPAFLTFLRVSTAWILCMIFLNERAKLIRAIVADSEVAPIDPEKTLKEEEELKDASVISLYKIFEIDAQKFASLKKHAHHYKASDLPAMLRVAEKDINAPWTGDQPRGLGIALISMIISGHEEEAAQAHAEILATKWSFSGGERIELAKETVERAREIAEEQALSPEPIHREKVQTETQEPSDINGFDPSAFGRPATSANEPEPENPPEDGDELDGTDEGQPDEAAYRDVIDDPESPPELRRRALENLIKLQAKRNDD